MATIAMSRSQPFGSPTLPRRKKEQRTDIWSGLLRQTREAQARSRTQAVQHRELLLCGGNPEDQRSFLQSVSRPPPPQPPSRNQERRQQRPKGELRLSNQYAYGYGHVTLFSPPQQGGAGVQVLGAEAEEVAHVEVHTIPEPEKEYLATMRRLLEGKKEGQPKTDGQEDDVEDDPSETSETRRPAICILLSWKKPWEFLDRLNRWLRIVARALLRPDLPATDPMDVIKEASLALTVVVQHTEAQESLLREGYKEEDFDYISQCFRTAILPIHPLSSLVYTSANAPPQQPGSPLSEAQKVVFTSLNLDLAALSPKAPRTGDGAPKQDFAPKHEFMDRMAIVIPAGWDSMAFIRTLSENFAPEEMLSAWLTDLQPIIEAPPPPKPEPETQQEKPKANMAAAEVFESSPVESAAEDDLAALPTSPSKLPPSAVRVYQEAIQDPHAHKAPRLPIIEVTTKPDQTFLGEMRAHLQELEAQDRSREASSRASSAVSNTSMSSGRAAGLPAGDASGALTDLGDVSFNVGGVSYDTVSAEAAIERVRRPQQISTSSKDPMSPIGGLTPRNLTPKPTRPSRDREASSTPQPSSVGSRMGSESKDNIPMDRLEEYFSSLMKKSQGMGSRDGTPTRPKPQE